MTYEELVKKAKTAAKKIDGSAAGHLAVEFDITGEGEGAFYVEVVNGKATVEPFEYYEHDVRVRTDAKTALDIIGGKVNAAEAAQNGAITAEGNVGALETFTTAKKEPAAKKPAAKKTTRKTTAKKTTAKKSTAAKKTTAKKATAAKATTAKAAEKKEIAEKSTTAKPAAKSTTAKKPTAAKKTTAKKSTAAKKTTAKKTAAKPATAKTTVKKPTAAKAEPAAKTAEAVKQSAAAPSALSAGKPVAPAAVTPAIGNKTVTITPSVPSAKKADEKKTK